MISAPHLIALRVIYDRLKDIPVDWAITGSLGFALHGLGVPVNDIDIQTDSEGAYTIEEALLNFVTQKTTFLESETIRSHLGRFNVQGITVELMGGLQKHLPGGTWEDPVDVAAHREYIRYMDMSLPTLRLEYEESAYRVLGRLEKADMIKAWRENHD